MKNVGQEYVLADDFVWISHSKAKEFLGTLFYILIKCITSCIGALYYRIRIVHQETSRKELKSGCFLYCNHTQTIGDVWLPSYILWKKRVYTIVSCANLGIPFIGKKLPVLGAIPIPQKIKQFQNFWDAIAYRIDCGHCIAIYPEGHVWPYYTKIRPFLSAAFSYPVKLKAPSYCMTVTYRKSRFFTRPYLKIYLDGPFYPDETLSLKQAKQKLSEQIHSCMEKRSASNSCCYVEYREVKK